MKSSIKIDFESQDMSPIIRITQPFYREIGSGKTPAPGVNEIYNEDEEDVRDKLVRNFLHPSLKVHRNNYFKLDTYYPYTNGNITTIKPIQDITEEFKNRVRITIENLQKEAFRKRGPCPIYDGEAVKKDLAKAEEFFEWWKEFDKADIWKEYTDEKGRLLTDIFLDNNPKTKETSTEKEGDLPSRFQIGDSADYTTNDWVEEAFSKAKSKNDKLKIPLVEEDLDYIPHYSFGKVIAIKFTEGKVWYDILDDFTGKVNEGIDSSYVKHFSDIVRAELQQEQETK